MLGRRSLGTRTRNASLAADLRAALRQQSLRDSAPKEALAAAAPAPAAGAGAEQMSARGGSLSEEEVDMDEDDDLEDETEEERGGAPMPSCRLQQC